MATTINNAPPTQNHHNKIYHPFKSNPSSFLKLPFNLNFSHIKFNLPKPSTTLKPFLKPPFDPLIGSTSGRGDFRVGSGRRVGSKGKKTRLIVAVECTKCSKNRYTTEKHKQNTPQPLELSKFCPVCLKHTIHKEVK